MNKKWVILPISVVFVVLAGLTFGAEKVVKEPEKKGPDIAEKKIISVLTARVDRKVKYMQRLYALWEGHCLMNDSDTGPQDKIYDMMPKLKTQTTRIYKGTKKTGSYNHHSQLAKFKGRYYFAFSNAPRTEEEPGQRIMLSSSADGVKWTKAECIIPGDAKKGLIRSPVGLYSGTDALYLYCLTQWAIKDATVPGMRRIISGRNRIDVFSSKDGETWQDRGTILDGFYWMSEGPRLTKENTLMAAGTRGDEPVVYQWNPSNPAGKPQVVALPVPDKEAQLLFGEGSWYQTDDGRIWLFSRDEGQSLHLYVSLGTDSGLTWTKPILSDIPDAMSRVYAGRLSDGRFYLVGNAYPKLHDRRYLMLLVSNDGYKFNKIYTLRDEPTTQRRKGLLKLDGYQYPCAIVDGDKLLVGYSVNKEDIECSIVDISMY